MYCSSLRNALFTPESTTDNEKSFVQSSTESFAASRFESLGSSILPITMSICFSQTLLFTVILTFLSSETSMEDLEHNA